MSVICLSYLYVKMSICLSVCLSVCVCLNFYKSILAKTLLVCVTALLFHCESTHRYPSIAVRERQMGQNCPNATCTGTLVHRKCTGKESPTLLLLCTFVASPLPYSLLLFLIIVISLTSPPRGGGWGLIYSNHF